VNPLVGIAGVLTVLGGLVAAVRPLQGVCSISPELSRKAVHVGMGCVCLAFPWVFNESWPVIVLALLAMGLLAVARVIPVLAAIIRPVLGSVERRTLGEVYFPAGVAIVFVVAQGDALLFVIPVLTLTVADSVCALIGGRYGTLPYQTDEGFKSAEGSAAFFLAAFFSVHVPLLLFSAMGRAECLLIALVAGVVVMLLEAIAWRGQDNLIIPIAMFLLLRIYAPLSAGALAVRLAVILLLVFLVVALRKRTTLSDSAVLAGALAGYGIWAYGGWAWLAAPVLLFLIYTNLPPFPMDGRPRRNLHAVTRVMAGGYLWLLVSVISGRGEFLVPYLLCMAGHTANIIVARLRVIRPGIGLLRTLLIAVALTAFPFGILAGLVTTWQSAPLLVLAVVLSLAQFVPWWPRIHTPQNRLRVWMSETLPPILASLTGLWIALGP